MNSKEAIAIIESYEGFIKCDSSPIDTYIYGECECFSYDEIRAIVTKHLVLFYTKSYVKGELINHCVFCDMISSDSKYFEELVRKCINTLPKLQSIAEYELN